MRGGTLRKNIAKAYSTYGGGMYCSDATCSIESAVVEENEASYGGGICQNKGQLNMSYSKVLSNTARGGGGGLYAYSGASGILGYLKMS